METATCSIKNTKFKCSDEGKVKEASRFSEKQLRLIQRRSGVYDQLQSICLNHERQFLTFYEQKQTICCDPFARHKSAVKTNLWAINDNFDQHFNADYPVVIEGKKLCSNCRNLMLHPPSDEMDEEEKNGGRDDEQFEVLDGPHNSDLSGPSGGSQNSAGFSTPPDMLLEQINESLTKLGIESVKRKWLANKSYRRKKVEEIKMTFETLFDMVIDTGDKVDYEKAGFEIISQLKDKFETCQSYTDKIQILSLLPASWTVYRTAKEFDTTKYLVSKTKQLVAEDGIMCTPKPKPRHVLPEETINQVINFYLDPEVSRELPGMKDFVSVRNCDGKREHKQKRLVLGNLKEIYSFFKERNPNLKISFSKFAELRPKQCKLAGASGTHVVCVCLYHENFNLMISAAGLLPMKFNGREVKEPTHVLKCIKCEDPTRNCHLRTCPDCLDDSAKLEEMIIANLESNLIESLTYQQWTNVDRCSLETLVKSSDQFVETLMEQLNKLSPHHYICKQQAEYFRQAKKKASEKEVVVVADFSENYSMVLQNSTQGVHWDNTQATVHPFCCYKGERDSDLLSFVIISDDLSHDTSAVNYFQHLLIAFLKARLPDLQKIIYFSDGAPQQYKNRNNILNLSLHEEDFGISAEWHFYPTSHGKGPSDGLGGTIKRLAARASLQLPPKDQIQTAVQFFEWSKKNIKGINIEFAKKDDVEAHRLKMDKRFKFAKPVTGIRGFHACMPTSNGHIEMKLHSLDHHGSLLDVAEQYNWAKRQPPPEPISTR